MNINEMTIQEVEARLAEIKNELEQRSGEELAALEKEVADLNARKAELKAVEERMAIAKKITEGSVSANVLESRKAEEKNDNWRCHSQLERGNACKCFVGMDFAPV